MRKNRLFIPIILLIACCSTYASVYGTENAAKDSVTTILFVGNSLTYTNDLPGLVATIGKEKGTIIKTMMLAFPSYALEDHWNDGQLQKLLAENHFDFVVVQQGPSSQQEGRGLLLNYGAKIQALCDTHHARLAFFMVWPAFANLSTFDGVIKNYTDAATQTKAILCPVGTVWKEQCVSKNDYSWYGPDMFHPSPKGSEAAAKIIYESLFK